LLVLFYTQSSNWIFKESASSKTFVIQQVDVISWFMYSLMVFLITFLNNLDFNSNSSGKSSPAKILSEMILQYKNFKCNLNTLVTPFDIHETMIDLLEMLKTEKQSQTPSSRKVSLFQQIPNTRSCSDADVDTHWCGCLKRKKLLINDYTIELAKKLLII
jgi:hypothetical protein